MAFKSLVSIYDEGAQTPAWVKFGDDGVGGVPTPSDYTGSSSTLVSSGRNPKGQVIGDVINSDIAKIELRWNFLTKAQFSRLAKLFEPKHNGSFFVAVSFFDVIAGDWDGSNEEPPTDSSGNNPCRLFYPNDRKVAFAKMVLNDDGSPKGYQNVQLNLIDTGNIYGE